MTLCMSGSEVVLAFVLHQETVYVSIGEYLNSCRHSMVVLPATRFAEASLVDSAQEMWEKLTRSA